MVFLVDKFGQVIYYGWLFTSLIRGRVVGVWGSDVFFTTEESLLGRDPGSVDLYDARIGGGFSQSVVKPECEGEACQSPPLPPAFVTSASSLYSGPGNRPGKKRCPKGKRKVRKGGKTRCVKKYKKKNKTNQRRANANRGAAR